MEIGHGDRDLKEVEMIRLSTQLNVKVCDRKEWRMISKFLA